MQSSSVVIIDDEQLFCKTIKCVLSNAGYDTHAFNLPGDALDFMKKHSCDLMITDFRMPEMDGISLIAKAKEVCPCLRTVMISAHLSQIDRDLAELVEVDLLMEKPVDLKLLLENAISLLSASSISPAS